MDSKQGLTRGPLKELYADLYKDLPYHLEHCLGSDPKSALFKARDRVSGEPLEVRILEFGQPFIASRREPLLRILEALKEIRHQNLISLQDYILSEQRLVLATEPFPSIQLQSYVEDPQNEPGLAFHALFQVLSGLEVLHEFGIIHTDLSPHNIFLDSSGMVKLALHPPIFASFGFDSASPAGTPGYTAPELWNNEFKANQICDVFSFGSLLYFCITGGFHPARILSATKIPEKYREVILCARGASQDSRYQNLRDLEYAILALGGYEEHKKNKPQVILTLEDLESARREDVLDGSSHIDVVEGGILQMIWSGLKPYWKLPQSGIESILKAFKEQFSEILTDTREEIALETRDLLNQTKQKIDSKRRQKQEKSEEKKRLKEERKRENEESKAKERKAIEEAQWEQQRKESAEKLKIEMEKLRLKRDGETVKGTKKEPIEKKLPANFGVYVFGFVFLIMGFLGYREMSFSPQIQTEKPLTGESATLKFAKTSGKIKIRKGYMDSWNDLITNSVKLPTQIRWEAGSSASMIGPDGKMLMEVSGDSELILKEFKLDTQGFEKVLHLSTDMGRFDFDLSKSRTLLKFDQLFGEVNTRGSVFSIKADSVDFRIIVSRGAVQLKLEKEGVKTVAPGERIVLTNGKISYHGKDKK